MSSFDIQTGFSSTVPASVLSSSQSAAFYLRGVLRLKNLKLFPYIGILMGVKWLKRLLVKTILDVQTHSSHKTSGLISSTEISIDNFIVFKNASLVENHFFNVRSIIFAPLWWKVSQCDCLVSIKCKLQNDLKWTNCWNFQNLPMQ